MTVRAEPELTVDAPPERRNEVVIAGRLSADPEMKELPSGDSLWTFRVVVPRTSRAASRDERKPGVDALECSVWSGRIKRSVQTWRAGDMVQVEGEMRRRFFRSAAGTASRVEVEVEAGRIIRRAAT